ncbi:hypothetical protein [Kiloniella sp. EL199]|uniref:hypothetical protein n=1 Tax=Kiloniella sp. EL199 TaxID=2107581 RepID=UPI000EA39B8B|nr:hypothetical protein [Kiloniella sp. EL199]
MNTNSKNSPVKIALHGSNIQGTNVQKGVKIIIQEPGGNRLIEDRDISDQGHLPADQRDKDGRANGQIFFTAMTGNDGRISFEVNNPQASDFKMSFNPAADNSSDGNYDLELLPAEHNGDYDFLPVVSIVKNEIFIIRVNMSEDQVDHYKVVTNNNL